MLVVTRQEIEFDQWNPAFENLTIAMISDVHGGSNAVDEVKLREVVRTANELNADVIVLLGDFVSESSVDPAILKMPVETVAQNLEGLRARYGVYVIMGNHDTVYGGDRVEAAFAGTGYQVLRSEIAEIDSNGAKLRLIGLIDQMDVEEWGAYAATLRSKLAAFDASSDVIALTHSPDPIKFITGKYSIAPDLRLVLAGHTHGGQVRLPLLGRPIVPSTYGQKYAYGHSSENGVDMFVTAGVGTSILPFRFLVPPEIMLLTVKSKAG